MTLQRAEELIGVQTNMAGYNRNATRLILYEVYKSIVKTVSMSSFANSTWRACSD